MKDKYIQYKRGKISRKSLWDRAKGAESENSGSSDPVSLPLVIVPFTFRKTIKFILFPLGPKSQKQD